MLHESPYCSPLNYICARRNTAKLYEIWKWRPPWWSVFCHSMALIPNFMKTGRPTRDCEHDIRTLVWNFNLIFHMLCLDWAEKTAVGWERTVSSPESWSGLPVRIPTSKGARTECYMRYPKSGVAQDVVSHFANRFFVVESSHERIWQRHLKESKSG